MYSLHVIEDSRAPFKLAVNMMNKGHAEMVFLLIKNPVKHFLVSKIIWLSNDSLTATSCSPLSYNDKT